MPFFHMSDWQPFKKRDGLQLGPTAHRRRDGEWLPLVPEGNLVTSNEGRRTHLGSVFN